MEGQLGINEEFSFYRYVGEYFREASVLIFVFGFLDPLVPQVDKPSTIQERITAIPVAWAILVTVLSLALLVLVSC